MPLTLLPCPNALDTNYQSTFIQVIASIGKGFDSHQAWDLLVLATTKWLIAQFFSATLHVKFDMAVAFPFRKYRRKEWREA